MREVTREKSRSGCRIFVSAHERQRRRNNATFRHILRFEADKEKNGAKFNQIFFGMPPQGIPASRIVSGNLATACGKIEVLTASDGEFNPERFNSELTNTHQSTTAK